MSEASGPLVGRRVLVTRPAGQGARLADAVAADGGLPIVFPVIEIADIDDPADAQALIDRLEAYDYAVFVSPNAVERGLALVRARRAWPAHLAVATVGKGSEAALARQGFGSVIAPAERFDSEGLLELLPEERVRGRRVIVFRGDGGRELLGETLAARGASVDYLTCYRRRRPDVDVAPLESALARGEVDAITATSSEGIENMLAMVAPPAQAALRRVALFAPHPRIAEHARRLGFAHVVQTAPGDDGLLAGMQSFFAKVSAS